jgi:hypothetical protein
LSAQAAGIACLGISNKRSPEAENPLTMELWAIHSDRDQKPIIRGFARTREEAQALLERVRTEDGPGADETYWVTPVSEDVKRILQPDEQDP